MRAGKLLVIGVAVLAFSGCAIKQRVEPTSGIRAGSEICVVDNPRVRPGFRDAIIASLKSRGLAARQVAEASSLTSCTYMLTYTANWNWDLALYLRLAQIKVYRDATPIGEANYDSTYGGGRLDKWVDAEKKVDELIGKLFPTESNTVTATPGPSSG